MDSQNQMILKHLKSWKPITHTIAERAYGVARLAARIHNIKAMGYEVPDRWKKLPNKKRVKEYLGARKVRP